MYVEASNSTHAPVGVCVNILRDATIVWSEKEKGRTEIEMCSFLDDVYAYQMY